MNKRKLKEKILIIEARIDEMADGNPTELGRLMDEREQLDILLEKVLYPNGKINGYRNYKDNTRDK
jgi:hypothetical protein